MESDPNYFPMIASFRMYNAVAGAAAAWRAMFAHVFREIEAPIEIVEHAWPAPLDALWSDPRLACGFMCGWPFVRSPRAMQAIAAPVPSPARYQHQPRYCSEFLVRESSGWTALEQTFGHRFGWMAPNSQSGFNAPRAHLATFTTAERPNLYREVAGPLGTPMRTLEALRQGDVDVIALDGYFLDLCRRHEPQRLAGIRTVATTAWTPIPLLVASPEADPATVAALRGKLLVLHTEASCRSMLDEVLIERFVAPDVAGYRALETMAEDAAARGYGAIR
jgi:ABC-type phosphate/phosphonate transport system substrate-binding protein